MEKIRMEGDLPITKWEDFKTIINSLLCPVRYVEDKLDPLALLQEKSMGRVYRNTPSNSR